MYTVIVILILVVSVLLGLIVLVQNSKGGGLVANFGGASQMMGVRQTTNFLEKATWTMAIILVVLCLVSSMTVPRHTVSGTEVKVQVPTTTSAPDNTQNSGETNSVTSEGASTEALGE